MAGKKPIQRGEKVELKLTEAEWALLLDARHGLTEQIRDVVSGTPPGKPVMIALDDLEILEGHVAAEANHTKDKKLQKQLDAISEMMLSVLDQHGDEPDETESPTTISFLDRFVETLVGSGPLVEPLGTVSERGEDQYGVKLTDKQRDSLIQCTELSKGLESKIQQADSGTQTLGFTRGELDELASEVDLALASARTPHKQRLTAVFDKLSAILETLELDDSDQPDRPLLERTGTIYQLKVTLKGSNPPVWRRFQVPDLTLGELHDVLQVVMGWQDSHMHQFVFGGKYYGRSEPGDDMEVDDEDGVLLSQILTGKKPRIVYEYDFGDDWQHDVILEKTLEPKPGIKYPLCLEGERACPPEDCDGVWGYADFLEAIGNPKYPEHREMKAWIGGKFDPERFDVEKVNRELRRISPTLFPRETTS
jgi:hypothetical protein